MTGRQTDGRKVRDMRQFVLLGKSKITLYDIAYNFTLIIDYEITTTF